jgi:hypothetical protein
MIKCRIHIYNDDTAMDMDVYTECLLPAIPQIDSVLHLNDKNTIELEQKARSSKNIAERYLYWFYGKSCSSRSIDEADLNDLSFDDAVYVTDVRFISDSEYVDIELYDDEKSKIK